MKIRFLTKNIAIQLSLTIGSLLSLWLCEKFAKKTWGFLLGAPSIFFLTWICLSIILLRNKDYKSVPVSTHVWAFILTVTVVVLHVVFYYFIL